MSLSVKHEGPVQVIRNYHCAPRKLPRKVFGSSESGSMEGSSDKSSVITELLACLLHSVLSSLMAVTIFYSNLPLHLFKEWNFIL